MSNIKNTNCGVYKITCLVPNKKTKTYKVYIGSSNDLKSRKWDHFSSLRSNKHSNSHKGRHTVKVINLTTNKIFNSIAEAAKFYSIKNTNIFSVCRNISRTAGGYKWAYLDNDFQ